MLPGAHSPSPQLLAVVTTLGEGQGREDGVGRRRALSRAPSKIGGTRKPSGQGAQDGQPGCGGAVCREGNFLVSSPFRRCWGHVNAGTSSWGGLPRWTGGRGHCRHQTRCRATWLIPPDACHPPGTQLLPLSCLGLEVWGASHSPCPLGLASGAGLSVELSEMMKVFCTCAVQ